MAATEFELIVVPHLDAAFNLARWLMGDAGRAEDVVQDAVLRALGYFASYKGGDARAWLLRIVRNTAYSALGAASRAAAVSLDQACDGEEAVLEIADPAADPESALAHAQGLRQLDAALAALPIELKECLVLRELEELSYKEISQVTGTPIGTVMSRLWRARQMLLARKEAWQS